MTPIGSQRRPVQFLGLFLALLFLPLITAIGCSSITNTNATPTAQLVCDDQETGAGHCGGDFDKSQCLTDLSCNLALYRTEIIDLILSCGDRLSKNQCPPQKGYLCDEDQDRKVLSTLTLSPAGEEYVRLFATKSKSCSAVGITLRSSFYDQALYMKERVWLEARPCLEWPCANLNECLTGAIQHIGPFCP